MMIMITIISHSNKTNKNRITKCLFIRIENNNNNNNKNNNNNNNNSKNNNKITAYKHSKIINTHRCQ